MALLQSHVPSNATPGQPGAPGTGSSAPGVPSTEATMAAERANVSFSVHDLSVSMHGSERNLQLKLKFSEEFSRDPAWQNDDIYDLSKEQIRERTMKKFHSMVHYVTTESIADFTVRMQLVSYIDPGFWTRFGVHCGLSCLIKRAGN